jgi:hypothetical protein
MPARKKSTKTPETGETTPKVRKPATARLKPPTEKVEIPSIKEKQLKKPFIIPTWNAESAVFTDRFTEYDVIDAWLTIAAALVITAQLRILVTSKVINIDKLKMSPSFRHYAFILGKSQESLALQAGHAVFETKASLNP